MEYLLSSTPTVQLGRHPQVQGQRLPGRVAGAPGHQSLSNGPPGPWGQSAAPGLSASHPQGQCRFLCFFHGAATHRAVPVAIFVTTARVLTQFRAPGEALAMRFPAEASPQCWALGSLLPSSAACSPWTLTCLGAHGWQAAGQACEPRLTPPPAPEALSHRVSARPRSQPGAASSSHQGGATGHSGPRAC